MDNKILLEELKRIKFISNYSLEKTSVENTNLVSEQVFRDLKSFLSTSRGSEVVRGEIETILKQGGLEIKTAKSALGGERVLTKSSEILKALKEGKLAESSIANLKGAMFKNTKDIELMESIARDIVNSDKFVQDYAHLSRQEILEKLYNSPLKLPKNSKQSKVILDAHEAKLIEDAKNAEELRNFENTKQFNPKDYKPYNSEREWKSYNDMKNIEQRLEEFMKRYPKGTVESQARSTPKKLLDNLKKAGLVTWNVGGWLIRNSIWILIFGGIAWAVVKNWQTIVNAMRGCGEGMVQDPETGECVKAGRSEGGDQNLIKDPQGNTYTPCSGLFKLGCVTSDGKSETGTDYITQAQDCLGLSPSGMFDKELENKLYNKINKRSFTKSDISLICMGGATLASL